MVVRKQFKALKHAGTTTQQFLSLQIFVLIVLNIYMFCNLVYVRSENFANLQCA